MKRILIKAYTYTNFGDDLFVKILCERYPKHKFYISCSRFHDNAFEKIYNLVIMNRSHIKGMIINNFKKLLTKLNISVNFPYDAQVSIGGSIFIEPKNNALFNEYFHHLYSIKQNDKLPYFVLGANFGPYHTKDFLEKHQIYFQEQVNDICMRDYDSYQLFKEVSHVRYAPDIVFNYQMPIKEKSNLIIISCIHNDERDELLNYNNDLYIKKIIALCNYYLSLGKQVCLLSLCSHLKDHITCQTVQKHFKDHVFTVEYNGNLEEITELFASAEYVIASRFHSMILGFLANVPVFPISYSNKTQNAVKTYGFTGRYALINDFCKLTCEEIDENRLNQYKLDIHSLQKEAQKHFTFLDKFLQN